VNRRRSTITALLIVFVVLLAPVAALFSPQSSTESPTDSTVEINVLAAASLSGAFTEAADIFSRANQNIAVKLSFAGSSALASQILAGAPMDVVAMADNSNMDKVIAGNAVNATSVQMFARNRLAIITPQNNPRGIATMSDLATPGLTVVLCDTSQPCGRYADQMFQRAGLAITPASRESSVTGVISRVRTGEADAGIAYISDAVANTDISAVSIPDADNVLAEYPIAIASTPSSGNASAAQTFLNFIMSSTGQKILKNAGFIRVS
jgi:molybdate transport system substrate-binding protein